MAITLITTATAKLFNHFYENGLFIKYLDAYGISYEDREEKALAAEHIHQINYINWLVESGKLTFKP